MVYSLFESTASSKCEIFIYQQVMRAVESSTALEVVIATATANTSAEEKLMKTKVRGRDNPTRWVLSGADGGGLLPTNNNGSSVHL